MVRRSIARKELLLACCCVAAAALATTTTTTASVAADLTGREILSVSRIAHGGADYANMQNVTVKAGGVVNAAGHQICLINRGGKIYFGHCPERIGPDAAEIPRCHEAPGLAGSVLQFGSLSHHVS